MKVLGLDYGERYIGVAVGESEIGVATPRAVLENIGKETLREAIEELIRETGAERLVVGVPLSFKMEETIASAKARAFGRWLRREYKMPVDFENEVLSSSHAERLRPHAPKHQRSGAWQAKRASHAVAASLILQNWLDRNRM